MTEVATTAEWEGIVAEPVTGRAPDRGLEAVVVALAAALTVAFVPWLFIPSYTPRLALVVVLGAVGAVGVVRRAVDGDSAARVAAALCAWIVLSASLSGQAIVSLLGVFGRESSALILAGSVLGWGAAREIGSAGRERFERLLLWGLLANAFVGLAQVVFNIESGSFQLYGGRATGLLVSHVAFGACMAGGAALVAARPGSHRDRRALALIALFAAMANLSGSRLALLVGFLATAGVFVTRRPRRDAVAPVLTYVMGAGLSVLAATFVLGGESATERAATAGSAGRLEAWGYGLRATLDRPLLGWGPGRFRAAVQGRFSAEFTGTHAGNELTQIWWDAHNIVVNTAATLGVVGLALAVVFGFLVVRRARGPLAWFAGIVATSWLLQPAGLATLPLVLFSLGAASIRPACPLSSDDSVASESTARAEATRLALLFGVALSLLVVLADVQVKAAVESRSADSLAAAADRVPWDPVVADLAAEAQVAYGSGPGAIEAAILWEQAAIDREPDRPYYRNRLAQLQLAAGQTATARRTLDSALALQPWNTRSWALLGVAAARSEDEQLQNRVAAARCAIEPTTCEPGA